MAENHFFILFPNFSSGVKNHSTSEKSPRCAGHGIFWEKNPSRPMCVYGILKSKKNTCDIMNISTIFNTGQIVTLFS